MTIWRFPKSCWYPHHPWYFRIFHEINRNNQAAIKGYPHGNPASQLGSPNWESSAAQLICRASLLPVDDGEVLGPKVGCLGPWGSSGFLWLVTWVAEDVYTIYKWNKPRIGDLRSPGSFILCVSQLRWSSIIANPWHFSCWTWWTMGFWVDSFGGLNLQKTVVSTSGKKRGFW